jgi:hypothetical protein
MDIDPVTKSIDPGTSDELTDVEKTSNPGPLETDVSVAVPQMTVKRMVVLFSLTSLYISAGCCIIFLGGTICTPILYSDSDVQHMWLQTLGALGPRPGSGLRTRFA